MVRSKDESQPPQENKPSPAKQGNAPQQAGEKKVKSKQPHQVTNDIKWVPFLIGFHLVTQALNRLSLRRPSAPRREEREDGNKRWHSLSDKTLHRLGNFGMITYQALLFLAYNFSATIDNEGVQVPETPLKVGTGFFLVLLSGSIFSIFSLSMQRAR